jgi:hypothetical protein
MTLAAALPTFETQLRELLIAEQGDGWLSACERADRFLLLSRQLVTSLAGVLRSLGHGKVLEVCAGRGELAEALGLEGVPIVATDTQPDRGSHVIRADAAEALRRHRPALVLASFVPIDSGVDERVMRFPSVRHYVVLGARIGGLFGSAALWQSPGWTAEPLAEVNRWMLTRHDVWLGTPGHPVLRHGEAWHWRRNERND